MEHFRPFFELNRIQSEINRLFETLSELREGSDPAAAWTPNVDIHEGASELVLNFELPGVDPSSVRLSVNGNSLILRGNKPRTEPSARRQVPLSGARVRLLPARHRIGHADQHPPGAHRVL